MAWVISPVFLIYIILFIYGTMVMRGVMEEKVSRIAEVIVSSVKPFQLMLGKIFGIGAVGLVQFIIWVVLVLACNFCSPLVSRSYGAYAATANISRRNGCSTVCTSQRRNGRHYARPE